MDTIKNKILDEQIKNIPLENKIRVSNQMAFIDLIVELGFREDKAWTDDEDEFLEKLMNLANEHTETQLKLII
jgi:hypothetical protein